MSLALNGTNGITYNDGSLQSSAIGKNLIINGNMAIDQRNGGASVTPTSGDIYTIDRWEVSSNVSGKISIQQVTTSPVGFASSAKITSTSAYTIGASELVVYKQKIEGYNISDLAWGTANAKTITISFWVRSSLTGTFGGALNNNGSTRNYAFTYTISVADTWEQKTITIPGDTTGTWLTTNGIGLSILIGLGVGTAFSGTAGSWSASFYASATGATSVVGTSGATFYITGVQLEANTTATPFENLQYGQQLALCQRYYYKEKSTFAGQYFAPNAYAISTTSAFTFNTFPVPMRTRPTALEQSGTASDYSLVRCGAGTSTICNSVPTFGGSSLTIGQSVFSVASGLSNGFAGSGMSQSTNAYLAWSAEL
jgi:hypothetical protein